MNKTSIVFVVFALVSIAFTVGYKLGDASGYNDGYGEGYSYDCRAEIDSLQKQVKDLNKVVGFQKKATSETQRRLDSAAYERVFGVRDSLRLAQYVKDSADNWKSAKHYNDSVSSNGVSSTPRKCPNGEFSQVERLLQAMGTKEFKGAVNCANNRR